MCERTLFLDKNVALSHTQEVVRHPRLRPPDSGWSRVAGDTSLENPQPDTTIRPTLVDTE